MIFFSNWSRLVLAVGVLDVSQQFGAFASEVEPTSQEVAGGAHLGWIDLGLGDHAAAEQRGDLQGNDPIVLGLAAMDGFHVESVAEHEVDAVAAAEIGEPVRAEGALHCSY